MPRTPCRSSARWRCRPTAAAAVVRAIGTFPFRAAAVSSMRFKYPQAARTTPCRSRSPASRLRPASSRPVRPSSSRPQTARPAPAAAPQPARRFPPPLLFHLAGQVFFQLVHADLLIGHNHHVFFHLFSPFILLPPSSPSAPRPCSDSPPSTESRSPAAAASPRPHRS